MLCSCHVLIRIYTDGKPLFFFSFIKNGCNNMECQLQDEPNAIYPISALLITFNFH